MTVLVTMLLLFGALAFPIAFVFAIAWVRGPMHRDKDHSQPTSGVR